MYMYCGASVVVIQHLSFAFLTDFHFFRQHLPTAISTKQKKKKIKFGRRQNKNENAVPASSGRASLRLWTRLHAFAVAAHQFAVLHLVKIGKTGGGLQIDLTF